MRDYTQIQTRSTTDVHLNAHLVSVFKHMGISLLISAIVAFCIANSPTALRLIFGTPLKWVAMLAPLAFVFIFGRKVWSMSAGAAAFGLYTFAALLGVSLSAILIIYTHTSITRVFAITSLTFAAMAAYGYTTKSDLSRLGSFLVMAVIGMIIAGLINIFMQSSMLHFVMSFVGVIVFTLFTAYDVQNIKEQYYASSHTGASIEHLAIMGALSLYLDFINLFQSLLAILGDRE